MREVVHYDRTVTLAVFAALERELRPAIEPIPAVAIDASPIVDARHDGPGQ